MSDLDAMDGLTFETDRTGTIKNIGANNWNAFAIQNGAPEIEAEAVLDRNLFDFIEGTQIQDQFKQVMDRIALDPNWVWVLPFRCDSPDRTRNICQTLRPVFSGNVCTGFIFQSIEQYSQKRPPWPFMTLKGIGNWPKATPIYQPSQCAAGAKGFSSLKVAVMNGCRLTTTTQRAGAVTCASAMPFAKIASKPRDGFSDASRQTAPP